MWVKVCGLTTVANALQVVNAGVDAVGLNFYSKSKRVVSVETAKEIVAALPSNVEPVGLFVNQSIEEIQAILNATGIRTVQLHGDETPQFAAAFHNVQIIRAIRVDAENVAGVSDELQSFRQQGVELFACLIDAKVAESYGGTGTTAPWELIADQYDFQNFPPLILAGGLTPDNVEQAIHQVHPWGVDTASGVESDPGIKDPELTQEFVLRAKRISPEQFSTRSGN